jgi:hypothetical protein
METGRLIATLLLGLTGLLFLYASVKGFMDSRQYVHTGVQTDGEIVEVAHWDSAEKGRMWYARVKYRTLDGQDITFDDNQSASFTWDRVGRRVRVLYYSADPQHARINRFSSMWAGPIMAFAAGIVCLAVCITTLLGLLPAPGAE